MVGIDSHILATSVPDMDLTNEFQSEESLGACRVWLDLLPIEAGGLMGRCNSALGVALLGDRAKEMLEA